MGKRLVSLLTALALAVSAFASLTVAPAGAVVEDPDSAIVFPFVPNGEEYGNMGPWYGSITVQNPNDDTIRVEIWKAADFFAPEGDDKPTWLVATTLQPYASKTWSATQLFEDEPGGGLIVLGCELTSTSNPDPCEDPADNEYDMDDEADPEPIAGLAKITSPVATAAGRTSGQHASVTGYTALGFYEYVDFDDQRNLVFPIVQTNNGWTSVLHITSFEPLDSCAVTVTLYQSPSGSTDPSFGQFTQLLDRGKAWHLDLAAEGVPAGWVGQAWISSDCDVAATVDRLKAAQPWGDPVNMALTNQALVTDYGDYRLVLPLIFQAYNGWNTGIAIANLATYDVADVSITYFNSAGVAVASETLQIQPRAMEFVYRPATTDVGIGGFGSALIESDVEVLVAVDSVKYTGLGNDVGQALSYVAQEGAELGDLLVLPLFQKQGQLTGGNDNSGIALFNTGFLYADVEITIYDASGAEVAPTIEEPITARIPSLGQFILYAPSISELPGGFQGSVVVDVIFTDEVVVGVSNNVNYDVQFDGSAAFNMTVIE